MADKLISDLTDEELGLAIAKAMSDSDLTIYPFQPDEGDSVTDALIVDGDVVPLALAQLVRRNLLAQPEVASE